MLGFNARRLIWKDTRTRDHQISPFFGYNVNAVDQCSVNQATL